MPVDKWKVFGIIHHMPKTTFNACANPREFTAEEYAALKADFHRWWHEELIPKLRQNQNKPR